MSTPCLKTGRYAGGVANDLVDGVDKRPASRRVADDLLARIDAGDEFPVGAQLPTYRQLAADYDVAVNTAIAAVRLLQGIGAVTIRPNAGAHVRDRSVDVDVARELDAARTELAKLRTQIQGAGANLAALEERLTQVAALLPGGEDKGRNS